MDLTKPGDITLFMIRDNNTGLFSKGGVDALTHHSRWSKKGKVWSGLGPLKNHLRVVLENRYAGKPVEIPASWEVIAIPVSIGILTATGVMANKILDKK